ncbi:HNH endonuclease domain-containing protein [Dorcoceras hygrometricum]|uniref:HNH endonuclease domain-containing protein n=1 Tax=Dorcoceras hygrometricum TaxID=472368 RepID=A0A2Z7BA12_9LAMI|nr:HNH endonuclease domain-containing protein [Dorcoceras hygrometricum]
MILLELSRQITYLMITVLDLELEVIFVDPSQIRQSGPRPDPRLLRQTALEVLTRSARTDAPRKTRPEQIPAKLAAAAAVAAREREGGAASARVLV